MVKTISMLLDELNEYQDPFGKIKRLCEQQKLFQLTRGIYTTDESASGYCFAPVIYGPSYLSFDFALAYHNLIPEKAYVYTSATCLKGKKKNYKNYFGEYTYRDVPAAVFGMGIDLGYEWEYVYAIATAEKAICDKLYAVSPVANIAEMEELLFNNLRIDEESFWQLELTDIMELAPLYRCTNLKLLVKLLERHRRRNR